MRTLLLLLAAVTAATLLVGCGGDDDEDAVREATTALTDTEGASDTLDDVLDEVEDAVEDALTLDLEEQNGSGVTGTVEFSPERDGNVSVTIKLEGDDGSAHPAHIHPGSCAELDPTPKWPLENVVGGTSTTTIDVSLSDLEADEYAVNVHESAENADRYIACADVRNQ